MQQPNVKYTITDGVITIVPGIERIEEGNKITQQALLALLNHAIDGNDIAEVKKASKDLTDYLIRR